jgi:hypothetical protein
MRNTFTLNFSTIAFVAAVHAIGGIGLGMWLSDRVPAGRRRTALALMALGAILHRADATGSAARETRRRKDAQQTLAARTRK